MHWSHFLCLLFNLTLYCMCGFVVKHLSLIPALFQPLNFKPLAIKLERVRYTCTDEGCWTNGMKGWIWCCRAGGKEDNREDSWCSEGGVTDDARDAVRWKQVIRYPKDDLISNLSPCCSDECTRCWFTLTSLLFVVFIKSTFPTGNRKKQIQINSVLFI